VQIFNINTDQFIEKLIACVTYIISFLKNLFNNIISIRNVDFSLGNISNSFSIIWNFALSIFYILILITFLVFFDSLFHIVKQIIKWIIYNPIKYFVLAIYGFLLLLKYLFTPKSNLK
jgi:hypothetical protein